MQVATRPPVLSAEQRQAWERDGYLHLRDVLNREEIAAMLRGIDSLSFDQGNTHGVPGNDRDLKVVNTVERTGAFDTLLDHPNVFGIALSLMGPYIQVSGTEALVRQPHDEVLVRFHTDGGASLRHILPNEHSLPINFKVQFFLTDVTERDCGNFTVIPGSHRHAFPDEGIDWDAASDRAVQILAKAGDAVIFPWSVWHGVAPNKSGRIRKSLFVRYSQLWCRPNDYVTQPPEVLSRLTPRRRRLLGAFELPHIPMDYYRPTSKHAHIPTILGEEWADRPEFARYAETYKFFKHLETWKWDR